MGATWKSWAQAVVNLTSVSQVKNRVENRFTCENCPDSAQTARVLANAVIPNEYGIDPGGKLRIGSKICAALLGKILADLGNMREESIATADVQVNSQSTAFSSCGTSWQVTRGVHRPRARPGTILLRLLRSGPALVCAS